MKLLHNYNLYDFKKGVIKIIHIPKFVILIFLAVVIVSVSLIAYADMSNGYSETKTANIKKKKLKNGISAKDVYANLPSVNTKSGSTNGDVLNNQKLDKNNIPNKNHLVVSTIFWVGETANSDNGYIPNQQSAWDGAWLEHYGGVDDRSPRINYQPSSFVPKENPFYFALPYTDIQENGTRKSTANLCNKFDVVSPKDRSWCKNNWVKIVASNGTAYAQWEDVGPYEIDDSDYVFGTAKPKNQFGSKAGIDVSPAVADYLKLKDVDIVYWEFVTQNDVPVGPWSKIVTKSLGYTIN